MQLGACNWRHFRYYAYRLFVPEASRMGGHCALLQPAIAISIGKFPNDIFNIAPYNLLIFPCRYNTGILFFFLFRYTSLLSYLSNFHPLNLLIIEHTSMHGESANHLTEPKINKSIDRSAQDPSVCVTIRTVDRSYKADMFRLYCVNYRFHECTFIYDHVGTKKKKTSEKNEIKNQNGTK